MSGFQWLNELAQYVGRLLPRATIIPPTEHGVLFTSRGKAKRVKPGFYVWWPLIHALSRLPATIRSINISARCKRAESDGPLPFGVLTGMAAQYRIVDPVACALATNNANALVECRIISVVQVDVFEACKEQVATELLGHGIQLLSLAITHNAVCVPVFKFDDVGWSDGQE